MKKLLLLSIFFCSNAYAYTISLPDYISGNDVTIANLQSTNTTIENVVNGGIEGGINIKAGSLVSSDFSNSVSPVTRWDEAFNDFTVSGMLPATSASLTSNVSAGTSYVNGIRIQNNAQSHTYTASKDTYVYVNQGGYYVYQEVANGASAPSTPADTLLLAKVVSSGTALTSVSDLRTTSIQISANSSNFSLDWRNQAYVSWDSTTAMHVEPGQIAIGGANYTNIADTSSKTLATATNWIEGSVPNLTSPKKLYIYAYNNSGTGYDFKYSSADPVYSDSSLNSGGVPRYYSSGGTLYRAIGWAFVSADAIQSYAFGNVYDTGIKNKVIRTYNTSTNLGTQQIPLDDSIPQNTEGAALPFLEIPFVPTNPLSKIRVEVDVNFSQSGSDLSSVLALFENTGANAVQVMQTETTNTNARQMRLFYERPAGSISLVQFKPRVGPTSSVECHINGEASSHGRLFGGVLISSISAEEI